MSVMRIKCPSCKIPLLVHEHQIEIDREKIAKERTEAIEGAAIALLNELRYVDGSADPTIAEELADRLREALQR